MTGLINNFLQELNNNDAYKQTKLLDPQQFVDFIKKRFLVLYIIHFYCN